MPRVLALFVVGGDGAASSEGAARSKPMRPLFSFTHSPSESETVPLGQLSVAGAGTAAVAVCESAAGVASANAVPANRLNTRTATDFVIVPISISPVARSPEVGEPSPIGYMGQYGRANLCFNGEHAVFRRAMSNLIL